METILIALALVLTTAIGTYVVKVEKENQHQTIYKYKNGELVKA